MGEIIEPMGTDTLAQKTRERKMRKAYGKISYKDSNIETVIRRQRLKFFGHIMRLRTPG